MARYILTGNYTAAAMQGMIAHPSDRAAATAALIAASGGKLVDYYLTTGENDFLMVIEAAEVKPMLASLLVAGAAGGASNLKTVMAFTSAEFTEAQKAAGAIMKAYKPPN